MYRFDREPESEASSWKAGLVKGLILIEVNEANGNNLPTKANLTFDTKRKKNKLLSVSSGNHAVMQDDGKTPYVHASKMVFK